MNPKLPRTAGLHSSIRHIERLCALALLAACRSDRDKNGFTAADAVIEDAGPHGHQIVYADVNFAAAGDYDFEVRSYNSGGGGDLEVSVSNVTVPVPDDALDSGYWEVLSQFGASAIRLQSAANVRLPGDGGERSGSGAADRAPQRSNGLSAGIILRWRSFHGVRGNGIHWRRRTQQVDLSQWSELPLRHSEVRQCRRQE
jgi:hypothetical protein